MKNSIAIVVLVSIIVSISTPVMALNARVKMQVEKVTVIDNIYRYELITIDCDDNFGIYVVDSRIEYKPGDWVIIIIELCIDNNAFTVERAGVIDMYIPDPYLKERR